MSVKEAMKAQKEVGISLRERGWGNIRDYKGGSVTVVWNKLSPEARKDGMFILKKGEQEMVLNKDDLLYLLRNV